MFQMFPRGTFGGRDHSETSFRDGVDALCKRSERGRQAW
jgi:hypothetical protein